MKLEMFKDENGVMQSFVYFEENELVDLLYSAATREFGELPKTSVVARVTNGIPYRLALVTDEGKYMGREKFLKNT